MPSDLGSDQVALDVGSPCLRVGQASGPTHTGSHSGVQAAALSKEFLREVYYSMDLDGDRAVRRPEFTKAFAAKWSSALGPLLAAGAGAERREL